MLVRALIVIDGRLPSSDLLGLGYCRSLRCAASTSRHVKIYDAMLDLQPRSEEDILAEARSRQPYYEWRCKEALRILLGMREHICDAFITLDVVILKPICLNCRYRLTGSEWADTPRVDMVRLWPEEVDGRVRFYDAASNCVHFWPPDNSESDSARERSEGKRKEIGRLPTRRQTLNLSP